MINEDHYDTPWEIKNRAIAAALSQTGSGPSMASPSTRNAALCCHPPRQRSSHASDAKDAACRARPSTSTTAVVTSCRPNADKRSSVAIGNFKREIVALVSAHPSTTNRQSRNSTANVYTDELLAHRQSDSMRLCTRHSGTSHKVDSEKLSRRSRDTINEVVDLQNHHPTSNSNKCIVPVVSNRHSQCCGGTVAYDMPPPYRQRRSCGGNGTNVGNGISMVCNGELTLHSSTPSSPSPSDSSFSSMPRHSAGKDEAANSGGGRRIASPADAYPMVSIVPRDEVQGCCCASERVVGTENCTRPRKSDEDVLIHDGMERRDAERLLKRREVGDYLLRRRPEGNLALSLRSTEGVLHIKLEMRTGHWVLGEGPQFPTIGAMLRAYHRTELPVRGAEHVRLHAPLPADDF